MHAKKNPSRIMLKRTKKHHPPKPRAFPLMKQQLKVTNLMDCLKNQTGVHETNKKEKKEKPQGISRLIPYRSQSVAREGE